MAATRELTALVPPARVLILTTFRRDDYVFEALRAGASGFLFKDCYPQDLVNAIRTVAAGEALLAPAVVRGLIDAFVSGAVVPRAARDDRLDALTEREAEVLRQVAKG
ncbi:hypothetical protein [Streptomyces sp. CMB-StM0423]|uniref:hypothetical protein n=1 Tax=Streptomyces sp. CMB-StM0423 TaxID=2059884 RepID=UPI003FA34856